MAGFYPDVPDNRIAYDTNGSLVVRTDGSLVLEIMNATKVSQMCDMGHTTGFSGFNAGQWMTILFPYTYDIGGIYQNINANGVEQTSSTVEWSNDTTNGIDGLWSSLAGTTVQNLTVVRMRYPDTVSESGVKALRFQAKSISGYSSSNPRQFAFHIYGTPSATTNRLDFWDPTLDQAIAPAHFDWGDVARGSTNTLTYRIKNQSATLTANLIDVSTEILTDGTPSLPPMFEHSTDGTNFSSTINIGNLAPGAISGTLHVRKTLTTDAPLSLWWPRFKAAPGSWT